MLGPKEKFKTAAVTLAWAASTAMALKFTHEGYKLQAEDEKKALAEGRQPDNKRTFYRPK